MASIQEEASGKKGGEIRYLTPLNIEHMFGGGVVIKDKSLAAIKLN